METSESSVSATERETVSFLPVLAVSLIWITFAILEAINVIEVLSNLNTFFSAYFGIVSTVMACALICYAFFSLARDNNKEASKGLASYILIAPIGSLLTLDPVNTLTLLNLLLLFYGTIIAGFLGYLFGRKSS